MCMYVLSRFNYSLLDYRPAPSNMPFFAIFMAGDRKIFAHMPRACHSCKRIAYDVVCDCVGESIHRGESGFDLYLETCLVEHVFSLQGQD